MPKRVLQGVVVSDACNKTVIVRVERRVMNLRQWDAVRNYRLAELFMFIGHDMSGIEQ